MSGTRQLDRLLAVRAARTQRALATLTTARRRRDVLAAQSETMQADLAHTRTAQTTNAAQRWQCLLERPVGSAALHHEQDHRERDAEVLAALEAAVGAAADAAAQATATAEQARVGYVIGHRAEATLQAVRDRACAAAMQHREIVAEATADEAYARPQHA